MYCYYDIEVVVSALPVYLLLPGIRLRKHDLAKRKTTAKRKTRATMKTRAMMTTREIKTKGQLTQIILLGGKGLLRV